MAVMAGLGSIGLKICWPSPRGITGNLFYLPFLSYRSDVLPGRLIIFYHNTYDQ